MTRSQMIETVARKTGFTEAQVETTMDAMFDQIADCLRADEKVTIAGFGRFEMRPRKPKAYTNPKTKVSSQLESTSIPGFKASGRFKQKTAYEIQEGDWSSDVCSSDLMYRYPPGMSKSNVFWQILRC